MSAELYQALGDCGFTIPANATAYWVGEAMGTTDYSDLEKTPESVAGTTKQVAVNAAHLAGLLKGSGLPALVLTGRSAGPVVRPGGRRPRRPGRRPRRAW